VLSLSVEPIKTHIKRKGFIKQRGLSFYCLSGRGFDAKSRFESEIRKIMSGGWRYNSLNEKEPISRV